MSTNVSSIYHGVVEDVIRNVRAEFESDGVDEGVLHELQQLWELRLMQAGAIEGHGLEVAASTVQGSGTGGKGGPVAATPVHDLNLPYEQTEEYEAPTAEMLFPPTPSLVSTPEPVMYQYMPPATAEPDSTLGLDVKLGRPDPYMPQPTSWMNQKPRGVDVNVAYEGEEEDDENGHEQTPITKDFFTLATGKRKRDDLNTNYLQGSYIPQRDGVGDIGLELYTSAVNRTQGADDGSEWNAQKMVGRNPDPKLWNQDRLMADARLSSRLARATHASGSSDIPQLDGINDEYDDAVAEDYNEPGEEETQPAADVARRTKAEAAADSEGSEPPLNEDDDEDLDENDQGNEEPRTDHLVLAQFDKVTRSKNKWKCMLKDGIMHLNGKDILFVKANGEFEF